MKSEWMNRREDESDRQYKRRSDDSNERRLDGTRVNEIIKIRLEKKYETKTKTRTISGEKETEVKLEHNNVSGKGNRKRRYRYPNSPYGLVEDVWREKSSYVDGEELTEEENE